MLWNTVANRVGPAPQASNTMSAELSPDCGRAPGSLETFTTTAGLPVGTWHAVQFCVTAAAAGTMSLSLDGTLVKSWNTNTGTTSIGRIQLGDDASRTAVINYDDVVATR